MRIYILKPGDDEWTLTLEGAEEPVAAFSSEGAALNAARELATQRQGRVLVFHGDGRIEEVWNQSLRDENGTGP
jgi:hypothetical protein